MNKRNKIKYIWCAWIVGVLVSCTNEHNFASTLPVEEKVDVTVNVGFSPEEDNYLRSGDITTTANIKNVDVLVFDKDGKYLERINVDDATITSTSSSASFNIAMDATLEKRIFHLVVNARERSDNSDRLNFSDLTPGMTEQTAMEMLHTDVPNFSITETFTDKAFPVLMWGSFQMPNGVTAATKVTGVKLLRSVAVFDIQWPQSDCGMLVGGYLHQATTLTNLVPSNWKMGVANPSSPRPVPGASKFTYNKMPLTQANDGVKNHFVAYSYERNCSINDYQSIILEVNHASNSPFGNVKGYYKVALADGKGNPFNIIRNHRYIVNITSVNGPGYTDINTAIQSPPSNDFKLEIRDENDAYPIVVADGQRRIAASNNYFFFQEIDYNALSGGINGGVKKYENIELCRIWTENSGGNLTFHNKGAMSCAVNDIHAELLSSSPSGKEFRIVGTIDKFLMLNPSAFRGWVDVVISDDNLQFTLNVMWVSHHYNYYTTHISKIGANSLALDLLFGIPGLEINKGNWNLKILDMEKKYEPRTNWVTLSSDKSPCFQNKAPIKYVSEMNSKTADKSYIHVLRIEKVPANDDCGNYDKASLMLSGETPEGEVILKKIMVARYDTYKNENS